MPSLDARRAVAAEAERDRLREAISKFLQTATEGPLALMDEDVLVPYLRELRAALGGS